MKYKVEVLPESKIPIYDQRESGLTHTPFQLEYNIYISIKNGDETALASAIDKYFDYGFVIGRMSDDSMRQIKFWTVSTIAVAIHYAILGGLDETDAFNLSDEYLRTADTFKTMEECIDYLKDKALELTHLVALSSKKDNYSPAVRKCIHYIHIHLHEKMTIEKLAQEVGLSRDYLSTLFKKETGVTLHSYITDCRLEAALPMLRQGVDCDYISYNLGFCSQSHFIKCFKTKYGQSPAKYIKSSSY